MRGGTREVRGGTKEVRGGTREVRGGTREVRGGTKERLREQDLGYFSVGLKGLVNVPSRLVISNLKYQRHQNLHHQTPCALVDSTLMRVRMKNAYPSLIYGEV